MGTKTSPDDSISTTEDNHDCYKYRSPLLAALMSASLPGLGQLYNGQMNKAAWVFMAFVILTIPACAAMALWLPAGLTSPMLLVGGIFALAIWLYAISNAWSTASNLGISKLKPWQTSSLYVALFLVSNALVLPLLVSTVREQMVAAFTIPSNSMAPTVVSGDYIFANMRYNCPYCRQKVARGDVVILVNPNNRNMFYIKRVIGLPGDSIEIKSNQLLINGESTTTSEVTPPTTNNNLVTEHWGQKYWQVQWSTSQNDDVLTTVKPGHVFVLGDNRANSKDSRHIGHVPLSDVKGLARQIWFSKSKDGVRWNRIGLDLTRK